VPEGERRCGSSMELVPIGQHYGEIVGVRIERNGGETHDA
jgi:hypothetical protein